MGNDNPRHNNLVKLHLSNKEQNHLSSLKQPLNNNSRKGPLANHNKLDNLHNSRVLECHNNNKDLVHKDLKHKDLDHKDHNNPEHVRKVHNNKELVLKVFLNKGHVLKDRSKELALKEPHNREHLDLNSQDNPKEFGRVSPKQLASHDLLLLLNSNKPKYLSNSLNQVLHLKEFKVQSHHKVNLAEVNSQLEGDSLRSKLEEVNRNLKQEEDNHNPKLEGANLKPKPEEDSLQRKQEEGNPKRKQEEDSHRPKQEEASHSLKPAEVNHKPEGDNHKPKLVGDSLRPKQVEVNHRPKLGVVSLQEEDNLPEGDNLLDEVNLQVEELPLKVNNKVNQVSKVKEVRLLILWARCLVETLWRPLELLETLENKWAASSKDSDSNHNCMLIYISIDTHCIAAICAVSLL